MTPATMRRIKERRRKEREAKFQKSKARFMLSSLIFLVILMTIFYLKFMEEACQTYNKFC